MLSGRSLVPRKVLVSDDKAVDEFACVVFAFGKRNSQ